MPNQLSLKKICIKCPEFCQILFSSLALAIADTDQAIVELAHPGSHRFDGNLLFGSSRWQVFDCLAWPPRLHSHKFVIQGQAIITCNFKNCIEPEAFKWHLYSYYSTDGFELAPVYDQDIGLREAPFWNVLVLHGSIWTLPKSLTALTSPGIHW